ncbi:MAG TPA: HEAT repeat domain-containing protein [Labilithrix sp.]
MKNILEPHALVLIVGIATAVAACGRADSPNPVTVPPQPTPSAASAPPAASAPAPPEKKSTMRIDVGGRELDVELQSDKARFMAGDPIFLSLVWSAPREPIELHVEWMGKNERRQNTSLAVVFSDAHGPLPVRPSGPSFGGNSGTQNITPDHGHVERILVAAWIDKLPVGKVVAHLETDAMKARADSKAAWQPLHVALDLPLEVLPDDATAMGAVIDAIGERVLSDDYETSTYASMQLEVLDDPRTIPYWIKLADKPSYSAKYAGVTALGKYRDARALAAVVRVSKTKPEDLSRQEYTTEELRKGSAAQVRIAAVQALFFLGAMDELKAIAKNDPDPSVRSEARQFYSKERDPH